MRDQGCSTTTSCGSLTSCRVAAPPDREKGWPSSRYLLLLLVLVSGLRLWEITHTEVISRDTLHYIRMAWQLDGAHWKIVLPQAEHHPGYPVSIMLMSHLVRPFMGDDLVSAMQLSAQLACALAGVLLVIPMYYLGRELFDRRLSFWSTLLFQCLPASGRVLGDGLSEGLFLLWSACSLLYAARGLRSGCPFCFQLCGLFAGSAFLTRPEGAALLVGAGVVLLGLRGRRTWERLLVRGACLLVPALMVALPYNLTIGKFTAKPTGRTLTNFAELSWPLPDDAPPLTLTAQPLAIWWTGSNPAPSGRLGWSVKVMVQILSRVLFWVMWFPMLVGLWHQRRRLAGLPITWVMATVCFLVLGLLFWITVRLGYLSDRHMLLVLLCLIYPTAAGIDQLGRLLAEGLVRLRPALAGTRWTAPGGWALGLLLLLTVIPGVKSLEPLHHNRSAFRDVGYWLAEYTPPQDPIYDPFGWASYYAGRIFNEPLPGSGIAARPVRYVVVEETGNNHPHLLGWKAAHDMIAEGHGKVIHAQSLQKGQILVYELCN